MDLKPIEASEREKYTRIHGAMDYASQSNEALFQYCLDAIPRQATVLEIGSGTGVFLRKMLEAGYAITGSDITLKGIPDDLIGHVLEVPAWELPFADNAFDWIVSSDVMEHLPTSLVAVACREFERVAMYGQVHNIATFPGTPYLGYAVHLTVEPIEWWHRRFDFRTQDIHLIERAGGGPVHNLQRYVQK